MLGEQHAEEARKADGAGRTDKTSRPCCGNQRLCDRQEEGSF